eukprot:1392291-Amorphochlora_amoeboformis.AAC.1
MEFVTLSRVTWLQVAAWVGAREIVPAGRLRGISHINSAILCTNPSPKLLAKIKGREPWARDPPRVRLTPPKRRHGHKTIITNENGGKRSRTLSGWVLTAASGKSWGLNMFGHHSRHVRANKAPPMRRIIDTGGLGDGKGIVTGVVGAV